VLRLVAGELGGHRGPGITHTPITLVHATIAPGAQLALPWPSKHNALAYVLAGRGRAGSAGRPVGSGQLAVFGPGGHVVLAADATQEGRAPSLEVVLLGGRPIREPVAHYGPFVMNTRAELVQAVEDFQAGRLGKIPAHHVE
jgi:redox-sensitive bicupin YhaK (pirin superfamily)